MLMAGLSRLLLLLSAVVLHSYRSDRGIRSYANAFVVRVGTRRPSSRTSSFESLAAATAQNPWKANDASLLHRVYKPDRVPDDIDYIIIGSGIGGLWLAACLAKFNLKSLVLEQHYIAGGLQHTFTRKGYEFVPGLHYIANLELCQPLYEMVADPSMNITYLQAGNSVPADEHQLSSHDLRIGDLPIMHVREGIDNVRDELTKHFPEERQAISGEFFSEKNLSKATKYLTSSPT